MKREIQIAILALVTLASSIWGYNFISGKNLFTGDKTFYAIFDNVKDVNTATPVLINGLQVGSVITISPEPEDISQIKVGFQVKKNIRLPLNTIVELRLSSPLGGKEIELIFKKMCDGSNCAPNKSTLMGRNIGILGSLINPEELDTHVGAITESLGKTLDSLGDPNSDSPVDKAIYNLSLTLENLAKTTKSMEELMSKSSRNLEVSFANMATITNSLVSSNKKLSDILSNVEVMSKDMASVSLSETVGKTNTALDQAQLSLSSLEITMTEATETLKEINNVIQKMDKGEGSISLLLNNPELYNNIESSTKNLDLLLEDLRLNPRRYFKLFGKKVPEYQSPIQDTSTSTEK